MSQYSLVQNSTKEINGETFRFGLVVAQFNHHITNGLLRGAQQCFAAHNVPGKNLKYVQVPGAFELPLAARKLAFTGDYQAILCLGAVIRGGTPHFDYVCNGVTDGIMKVGLETDLPIIFGVLTTDTEQQALDRIDENKGNKGYEAALSAIQLADLYLEKNNLKL